MPKYFEDKEEDGSPCSGVKEDLRSCLLELDCVLKNQLNKSYGKGTVVIYLQEGKTPKQCLKEGHCKALQLTFFECKRSMVCISSG
ncbi:cytochrome c oxidase assembly factor 5 isoform X2 [Hemitrygon akajei]|uniref:cytochrome c oxidase assembly factor 5 isoform X2 n=1 Tax=Hemitrygon akajei TaxID=2704970 RepID=UPI003BF99F28